MDSLEGVCSWYEWREIVVVCLHFRGGIRSYIWEGGREGERGVRVEWKHDWIESYLTAHGRAG